MGRTCTICGHQNRDEIDHLIVSGAHFRDIAGRFGVSRMAVHRHKQHVIDAMALAQEAAVRTQETVRAETLAQEAAEREQHGAEHAQDLLGQAKGLYAKTVSLLYQAESAQDRRGAVQAARAARESLELLAKLDGQLREGATITINAILGSPAWSMITDELQGALESFPEAAVAAAAALTRLAQRLRSDQGGAAAVLAGSRREGTGP